MNRSLETAAHTESEMKAEINQLHRSLIEFNAHSQSDADKMKQVKHNFEKPMFLGLNLVVLNFKYSYVSHLNPTYFSLKFIY